MDDVKEIESINEKLRALEFHITAREKLLYMQIYKLEKTINWLSIATSLSFLVAFLLIAHK